MPARGAIDAFVDRLQPSDRVAVVVDGFGTASNVGFTTDRERVKAAVSRVAGQRGLPAAGGAPNHVIPVSNLAPGRYVLRAVTAAPNAPPHTQLRGFEKP